jgi:hypothetical protein
MVQMYEQQLATYEPGDQPSGFGYLAWISGQMLVYALIMSGHDPTRATLVKWFDTLTNWTGGGSLGAYTPSSRGIGLSEPGCNIDVEIQGDGFVRKSPPSGFFCGGQLVQGPFVMSAYWPFIVIGLFTGSIYGWRPWVSCSRTRRSASSTSPTAPWPCSAPIPTGNCTTTGA